MQPKTNGIDETDFILKDAIEAPVNFIDASAGNIENSTRGRGITLTKNEIVQLRLYEIAGLALPITLEGVIAYTGDLNGAGKGLAVTDFRDTFILVHNHAARWNSIRKSIVDVGEELKVFALQLQVYGNDMTRTLSELKGSNTFKALGITTLEDLKKTQIEIGDKFPDIELDADDLTMAKDFGYYLNLMLTKVKERQKDAETLKERLHAFEFDLSIQVRPAIRDAQTGALDITLVEAKKLKGRLSDMNGPFQRSAVSEYLAGFNVNIKALASEI